MQCASCVLTWFYSDSAVTADDFHSAAGLASGPSGRDRHEADRRSLRNSLLLSLHRVAVAELPQFEDLPLMADALAD